MHRKFNLYLKCIVLCGRSFGQSLERPIIVLIHRDRKCKRITRVGVYMCVCHEVKTFVVVLANYGRMLVTKFAPHFDLWENVPSPPTSLCCNDPCQSSVTFAIKRRFLNACAIYSLAGKFHTPLALRLTL